MRKQIELRIAELLDLKDVWKIDFDFSPVHGFFLKRNRRKVCKMTLLFRCQRISLESREFGRKILVTKRDNIGKGFA